MDYFEDPNLCLICFGYHPLKYCKYFKTFTKQQRRYLVKVHGYCSKCFSKAHRSEECPLTDACGKCNGPHHVMLHQEADESSDVYTSCHSIPGPYRTNVTYRHQRLKCKRLVETECSNRCSCGAVGSSHCEQTFANISSSRRQSKRCRDEQDAGLSKRMRSFENIHSCPKDPATSQGHFAFGFGFTSLHVPVKSKSTSFSWTNSRRQSSTISSKEDKSKSSTPILIHPQSPTFKPYEKRCNNPSCHFEVDSSIDLETIGDRETVSSCRIKSGRQQSFSSENLSELSFESMSQKNRSFSSPTECNPHHFTNQQYLWRSCFSARRSRSPSIESEDGSGEQKTEWLRLRSLPRTRMAEKRTYSRRTIEQYSPEHSPAHFGDCEYGGTTTRDLGYHSVSFHDEEQTYRSTAPTSKQRNRLGDESLPLQSSASRNPPSSAHKSSNDEISDKEIECNTKGNLPGRSSEHHKGIRKRCSLPHLSQSPKLLPKRRLFGLIRKDQVDDVVPPCSSPESASVSKSKSLIREVGGESKTSLLFKTKSKRVSAKTNFEYKESQPSSGRSYFTSSRRKTPEQASKNQNVQKFAPSNKSPNKELLQKFFQNQSKCTPFLTGKKSPIRHPSPHDKIVRCESAKKVRIQQSSKITSKYSSTAHVSRSRTRSTTRLLSLPEQKIEKVPPEPSPPRAGRVLAQIQISLQEILPHLKNPSEHWLTPANRRRQTLLSQDLSQLKTQLNKVILDIQRFLNPHSFYPNSRHLEQLKVLFHHLRQHLQECNVLSNICQLKSYIQKLMSYLQQQNECHGKELISGSFLKQLQKVDRQCQTSKTRKRVDFLRQRLRLRVILRTLLKSALDKMAKLLHQ